jgi:hypothetical protein
VSGRAIRPIVWVALATSLSLLAGAIGSTFVRRSRDLRLAERARVSISLGDSLLARGGIVAADRTARSESDDAERVAAGVSTGADRAAPAISDGAVRGTARASASDGEFDREPREAPDPSAAADRRSAELVGLERDASNLAEATGLVDRDAIEAQLAAIEEIPGETDEDFARRLDAERERIGSDEILVQRRLGELYATTVYPLGFPVERAVAATERQWIRELPQNERAILLRQALDDPNDFGRAQPRYEGFLAADALDGSDL